MRKISWNGWENYWLDVHTSIRPGGDVRALHNTHLFRMRKSTVKPHKGWSLLVVFTLGVGTGCSNNEQVAPPLMPSPPTIEILTPSEGDTLSDFVVIELNASDDKGITKVEVFIDNQLDSTATLLVQPYQYVWSIADLPDNSAHSIYARAFDADSNVTSTPVIVVYVRAIPWTQAYSLENDINDLLVFNGYVYVATSLPLLRSSDDGLSWTQVLSGTTNKLLVSGNRLFGGGSTNVWFSDDGVSWDSRGLLSDISALTSGANFILAGGSAYMYKSTDNGDTWVIVEGPLDIGNPITDLAHLGSYSFAGTYYGIFRQLDGTNGWEFASNGIEDIVVRTIAANNGFVFCGTQTGGVYRSSDFGSSWVPAGLQGMHVNSLDSKGDEIFASVWQTGTLRSTDNGHTWLSMGGPPSDYPCEVAVSDSFLWVGECGAVQHSIWKRELR